MTMMHMNSQVQQYGGFTPGQRVFGRTPKLPIGATDNPFFEDFMNPAEAPATEKRNSIVAIYEIRQASLKEDFRSKLNTTPIRRVRDTENEEFFMGRAVYFIASNRKIKKKESG